MALKCWIPGELHCIHEISNIFTITDCTIVGCFSAFSHKKQRQKTDLTTAAFGRFPFDTLRIHASVFELTVPHIDYALQAMTRMLNARPSDSRNIAQVFPSGSWITQLASLMFNSASEKSCWHTLYANCPVLLLHFYHHFERKWSSACMFELWLLQKKRALSACCCLLLLLGCCNHAILHLIGLYAKVLVRISMRTAHHVLVILPLLLCCRLVLTLQGEDGKQLVLSRLH